MSPSEPKIRRRASRTIGADTGGTFTDLAWIEGGEVRTEKVPSTPSAPGDAVLEGLTQLSEVDERVHVVHGTTVALNALLTGRVARTALITNAGFRDLIEIGRQDRPELYALHPEKVTPLAARELRFELEQRSWPAPESASSASAPGIVEVTRPTEAELEKLVRRVTRARPESIAICLLHSWADPEIEQRVARKLEPLAASGVPITCSAALLREYREFERFSTALVNAAVAPIMADYLGGLGRRLGGARLSILQSNGGTLPAERAASEPVRVLLSGPAGGVVGATQAARQAGFERLAGLDMGGTSTDVSFAASGRALAVHDEPTRIAGHPVGVPSLDIHTIGTGGGSLARLDGAGVLCVGPESAGADPGPVCYGRSDQLTVTDAHVALGHIASGAFLAGRLELDVDRVQRAFERLARDLSSDVPRAAQGVLDVARAAMRRAVGVMTMQRGEDPRALPLVAFGGAGGLHGAAVAQSLGMRASLVPAHPGVLSALGMAVAEPVRESTRTLLEPWGARPWKTLEREIRAAARELVDELAVEGHARRAVNWEAGLALRYVGQSFELTVPATSRAALAFHSRHAELYGYCLEREVEIVHVGVRATVPRVHEPVPRPRSRRLPAAAIRGERRAWFDGWARVPVVERLALQPGHRFEGPALVEEFSGTTLVPPGAEARVVAGGHLEIRTS